MSLCSTASAPEATIPLDSVAVHLHDRDDVAIAKADLKEGMLLEVSLPGGAPAQIRIVQPIPSGHKVALRPIGKGEPVHRYGQTIGFASCDIAAGEHVHTHNLAMGDLQQEYAFSTEAQPVTWVDPRERRTFMGYRRADGRVGTRNYIAIISSVNCSAHATREIAHHFTKDRLSAYPNVDGVIALTHHGGCSGRIDGPDYVLLQRTLAGMARHPNVGAYLLVGLGCEVNQVSALVRNYELDADCDNASCPTSLLIQELGGVQKTIQAGIATVNRLLPAVNAIQRTPEHVSELTLALHCGGSDSWSGITANPTVGLVSDKVVRQGGSVVLAETPEIYGAEGLLTCRAASPEIGQKLLELVRWWESRAEMLGIEIDNNPTPGNKKGGLTNIYEKSLGAITKAGSTPLTGVYEYAEPVTTRGFAFMNSTGNDWIGVTGQVASGCNLVVFTTGRGSAFGFKPAPTIKVCSNSRTYNRMLDDMDVNAGRILEGVPKDLLADELFELVVAVASGQPSKSEAQGIGEAEFCPWSLGAIL